MIKNKILLPVNIGQTISEKDEFDTIAPTSNSILGADMPRILAINEGNDLREIIAGIKKAADRTDIMLKPAYFVIDGAMHTEDLVSRTAIENGQLLKNRILFRDSDDSYWSMDNGTIINSVGSRINPFPEYFLIDIPESNHNTFNETYVHINDFLEQMFEYSSGKNWIKKAELAATASKDSSVEDMIMKLPDIKKRLNPNKKYKALEFCDITLFGTESIPTGRLGSYRFVNNTKRTIAEQYSVYCQDEDFLYVRKAGNNEPTISGRGKPQKIPSVRMEDLDKIELFRISAYKSHITK